MLSTDGNIAFYRFQTSNLVSDWKLQQVSAGKLSQDSPTAPEERVQFQIVKWTDAGDGVSILTSHANNTGGADNRCILRHYPVPTTADLPTPDFTLTTTNALTFALDPQNKLLAISTKRRERGRHRHLQYSCASKNWDALGRITSGQFGFRPRRQAALRSLHERSHGHLLQPAVHRQFDLFKRKPRTTEVKQADLYLEIGFIQINDNERLPHTR